VLNITKFDRYSILEEFINNGSQNIFKCIQCGACASVCPVARSGYKFYCKNIIKKIQIGDIDEILEDISPWACIFCYRCNDICPKNVNPADVIFALRRIQANDLNIPTSSISGITDLYSKGHAIYSDKSQQIRTKCGLNPIPETAINDHEAQNEIQILLDESPIGESGFF